MVINSRKELRDCLKKEEKLYLSEYGKKRLFNSFCKENLTCVFELIKQLRKEEYHFCAFSKNKSIYHFCLFALHRRKKNKLALKMGIYLPKGVCDEGIMIYHYGDIVVNERSVLGKNCKLHGNNCIGNDGIHLDKSPKLGENVDVGYGAVIIGDVEIADNVKIGAGAVVVHSCHISGATLVGCPARTIVGK